MATDVRKRARLADVPMPEFGMPSTEPVLPESLYVDRVERFRAAMERQGYEACAVWADREHSANLS
jgi:hypothetical protein